MRRFRFLLVVALGTGVVSRPTHATSQLVKVDGSLFDATGVPITGDRDVREGGYHHRRIPE